MDSIYTDTKSGICFGYLRLNYLMWRPAIFRPVRYIIGVTDHGLEEWVMQQAHRGNQLIEQLEWFLNAYRANVEAILFALGRLKAARARLEARLSPEELPKAA